MKWTNIALEPTKTCVSKSGWEGEGGGGGREGGYRARATNQEVANCTEAFKLDFTCTPSVQMTKSQESWEASAQR